MLAMTNAKQHQRNKQQQYKLSLAELGCIGSKEAWLMLLSRVVMRSQ